MAKPVRWMGSSLKDLKAFSEPVRKDAGMALFATQTGGTDPAAKPLQGFGGTSVMEIVAPFRSDTYRAVCTVQFRDVPYGLHTFQKKSKRGVATPQADIELIRKRLADAGAEHARMEDHD